MMGKEASEGKTSLLCNGAISEAAMDELDINPFYHRIHLTLYDKIKVAFLSVLLLPVRATLIIFLKLMAAIISLIAMAGLSKNQSIHKPITGWRKKTREVTAYVMRLWCKVAGFHNVKVKGRRATFKEAPILVLSPHSSPFDSIAFTYLGAPSLVAKGDFQDVPVWNTIVSFSEPVYVYRDDPNSRENTIKEIRRRATSGEEYNQIMIFPEGTCTNRSCLISFKLGAFLPGVPVQPVCLKFPNRVDTVTWAWDGPGILKMIWMTLTQFHSNFEMELLPVYTPSEEEKRNPRLFADNVRNAMARSLGVPTSNLSFNDCRLISQAKANKLPFQNGVALFKKLRNAINLEKSPKAELQNYLVSLPKKHRRFKLKDFSSRLGMKTSTPEIDELFGLFDRNDDEAMGSIDFREYIVGLHLISDIDDAKDRLQLIFKLYDRSQRGFLYQSEFLEGMVHGFNMPPAVGLRLYQTACKVEGNSLDGLTFDMAMRLATKDAELNSYLQNYHSQLLMKKAANKEIVPTETSKMESHDEQKKASVRTAAERYGKHVAQEQAKFQKAVDAVSQQTEHQKAVDNEQQKAGCQTSADDGQQKTECQKAADDARQKTEWQTAADVISKESDQDGEHVAQQDTEDQEAAEVTITETEEATLQEPDHLSVNQLLDTRTCGTNHFKNESDQSFDSSTQRQQEKHLSNGHIPGQKKLHITTTCDDRHEMENQFKEEILEQEPEKVQQKHSEHLLNGNESSRSIGKIIEERGILSHESLLIEKNEEMSRNHSKHSFNSQHSKQGQQEFTKFHGIHLSNGHVNEENINNNGHMPKKHSPLYIKGQTAIQDERPLHNGHVTSQENEENTDLKAKDVCNGNTDKQQSEPIHNGNSIFHENGCGSLNVHALSLLNGNAPSMNGRTTKKLQTHNGGITGFQNGNSSGMFPRRSKVISDKMSTQIYFSLDTFSTQPAERQLEPLNELTNQNGICPKGEHILQRARFPTQSLNPEEVAHKEENKKIS